MNTDAEERQYTAWALRLALAVTTDNPDASRETVAEIDAADGSWRTIAGLVAFTLERALDELYEGPAADWVGRQLITHLDDREES
jgi:hypothetical protein